MKLQGYQTVYPLRAIARLVENPMKGVSNDYHSQTQVINVKNHLKCRGYRKSKVENDKNAGYQKVMTI